MSDKEPMSIRDELDQQLATLAGPGAINCGLATERASAEQVSRCATAALAARQPFYCMYWQSSSGRSPVRSDGYPPVPPVWPLPAGYVGRADGVVFEVYENYRGTLVRGTDVLVSGVEGSSRRLGLGMTMPSWSRPQQLRSKGRLHQSTESSSSKQPSESMVRSRIHACSSRSHSGSRRLRSVSFGNRLFNRVDYSDCPFLSFTTSS